MKTFPEGRFHERKRIKEDKSAVRRGFEQWCPRLSTRRKERKLGISNPSCRLGPHRGEKSAIGHDQKCKGEWGTHLAWVKLGIP